MNLGVINFILLVLFKLKHSIYFTDNQLYILDSTVVHEFCLKNHQRFPIIQRTYYKMPINNRHV